MLQRELWWATEDLLTSVSAGARVYLHKANCRTGALVLTPALKYVLIIKS